MKSAQEMSNIIKREEEQLWKLWQEAKKSGRNEMAEKYRTRHQEVMDIMDELEIERNK